MHPPEWKVSRHVVLLLACWASAFAVVAADDWPQWGGPQRDGVWRESGIRQTLPPGELPRMWSAEIGAGYAGPAVAEGRVVVMDRIAEEELERVLAFDADTGRMIWLHQYKAPYTVSYPVGPRATPTLDDGRVYALGAEGHFTCLDGKTGRVLWQKNLPRHFGTKLPIWGMAAAPLVDDDQLILLAGGSDGALVVSLDKKTGDEKWRALDDPQVGYAAPVILEFGGRRQLIVWHQAAVSALDPRDGSQLWSVPFPVREALCIATPRKIGSRLFVATFYEGPLMIELGEDGVSPSIVWQARRGENELRNTTLHPMMCTPIVTEEHIFGVSSYGQLRGLETTSGNMLWETRDATGEGRWWNAYLVPLGAMNGEHVMLVNEQGELITARLDGAGYHETSRAKLIQPTQPIQRRQTIWSHPAFAMKSVFARNDKELIRVNLAAE